jgi:hypothetical protein
MNRKQFAVVTLIALVSLTLTLVPLASQQAGKYDPWVDYNEDGKIDVNELYPLGQSYGSSGDPAKNVNVTNWSVQHQTLSNNLRLKGAIICDGSNERRDLIDQTTYYPLYYQPDVVPTDVIDAPVMSISTEIFNKTYVYQKMTLSPCLIFGVPMISVPFTLSNSPWSSFNLEFHAYLGIVNMAGDWIQHAYVGNVTWSVVGVTNSFYGNAVITRMNNVPVNVWIEPGNRIAIRLVILGYTQPSQPNTALDFRIQHSRTSTDDFVVEIPIAENP